MADESCGLLRPRDSDPKGKCQWRKLSKAALVAYMSSLFMAYHIPGPSELPTAPSGCYLCSVGPEVGTWRYEVFAIQRKRSSESGRYIMPESCTISLCAQGATRTRRRARSARRTPDAEVSSDSDEESDTKLTKKSTCQGKLPNRRKP